MTLEAPPIAKPAVRKVLIVDDQADVREALRLLLKGAGYFTDTAESPNEALAAAAYREHDLIVIDMNYTWDTTSGEEGLKLLDRLRLQARDTPVIVMTGWSTIELAVEAMHRGACDFIPKPWENRHFLSVLEKHLNAAPPNQNGALNADLAIARKVQRKLLPDPHFSARGLMCECASIPLGDVSGDLYDIFETEPSGLAFLLGDVSGKGIGAALLMANLQGTIRSLDDLVPHPARLMQKVNRLFFQSTRPEHFATLFYGSYDSTKRQIRYVNCGHPAPVLARADGSVEQLETTATVLGAFTGSHFDEGVATLAPGDRLVLFSDGVSEADLENAKPDWHVETIRLLSKGRPTGLAGLLASTAAGMGTQADDITVMDIRAAA